MSILNWAVWSPAILALLACVTTSAQEVPQERSKSSDTVTIPAQPVPPWAKRKTGEPLAVYDEHAAPGTPPPPGLYVAMGDSITFGYGTTNPCQAFPTHPVDIESSCPHGSSYAVDVARALRDDGIAGRFMNLGINGARVKTMIDDELPYLPADATLITIYVGTNDSRAVVKPEISEKSVIHDYEDQYEVLLNAVRLRAPRARIILVNIPNQKYLAAGYHVAPEVLPRYDSVSQQLDQFIDAHYPRYAVVDTVCMKETYDPSMLYRETVHPNDIGAQILAKAVVRTILAPNPAPPPHSCQWFGSDSK